MSKSKTRRLLKILMPTRGVESRNQNRASYAFPREIWLEEYQGRDSEQAEQKRSDDKKLN